MIFLDVETQKFFSDVTDEYGHFNIGDLKVSFVGVYDSDTDKYLSFWEDDMEKLYELLKETSSTTSSGGQAGNQVVGYNIWAFDYGVLAPYMKGFDFDLKTLPTIDLMLAMRKVLGWRPKLNNLAKANFGEGKIGTGEDAGEYWRRGELDKLEAYCLKDVELTYEVWRVGDEESKLKYYDKAGFLKEVPVSWRDGFMQEIDPSLQGRLL